MGGKSKAPPPPDYSGVAQASRDAAERSFQLGEDQLAWAKQQASDNATLNKTVSDRLLADDERSTQWAIEDRARYEKDFVPLEDQYAKTAGGWDSKAREDEQAGLASATVADQFNTARHAATDQLEAYGIDPSQTRYAALDLGARLQGAASGAGAANTARRDTQLTGAQMLQNSVAMGRGLPGQALQEQNSGAGQGSAALSGSLQTTQTGASTMGTAPQWQSLGTSALGQWGNILNTGYQNQLQRFNANQNASSGAGALAGSVLGMGLGAFYGGGNSIMSGIKNFFATGGAVPAPAGYGIPPQASPSGGQAIDDVPAQLTAGEFVIPKDAASWLGEEKLQKLIQKTRQDRMGAVQPGAPKQGAIPQNQAPPQAQRRALPV